MWVRGREYVFVNCGYLKAKSILTVPFTYVDILDVFLQQKKTAKIRIRICKLEGTFINVDDAITPHK